MENNVHGFQVATKTYDEAMRFCHMMSESDLCPDTYKPSTYLNRICGQNLEARKDPENIKRAKEMAVSNIFIACNYGSTLGLNPFQSLQGIAMVNGKPSVYGDTLLGLVRPLCDDFQEWFDGQTGTAYCVILRRGSQHPVQQKFSYQDAQRAGLTSKKGAWTQYPERMLQMRARGFAIRDAFPDVLSGIITREEAEDYPVQRAQNLSQNQLETQRQQGAVYQPPLPDNTNYQNYSLNTAQSGAPLVAQAASPQGETVSMQQPASVQPPMNFQTNQEQ